MAIGKRIKFFRKRNRLTMKALGMFVGFKENSADVRIAQYESDKKRPRRKLIKGLADALGVVPEAITVPDIDTPIGLMHTLFALEDMYGITIHTSYGRPCLCVLSPTEPREVNLQEYLEEWCTVKMDLLHGRITKTEYDDWRYNYPRIERKIVDNTVKYTTMDTILD
jgi:transcriptional regulator with XRE-family HTH domain